jgi:lipid II:glycine glycyltransferase (peptidoglycan interpeptide bridge formation enzyme)
MEAWASVAQVRPEQLAVLSRTWLAGGRGGTVLVAREEGRPLAAALIIVYREGAYLRLLPSVRHDRGSGGPPVSHVLVWEAMRWAHARGCRFFDLEGYSLVARPGEPLWGVNQFKRGFAPGQEPRRTVAIHELVRSPLMAASARLVRKMQQRAKSASGEEV